jgi:Ala-tRNA(Pro) deacylase
MSSPNEIITLLDDLGIPCRTIDHPAVFTVAESAQHVKDKRPLKNLLLQEKGDGRIILVIMDGHARLDLKSLAQMLKSRKLTFASPEVMKKTLGVVPGAVSIFGLLHDSSSEVEVVIDEILLAEKELGFHPNKNTSTVFIPGKEIVKIFKHTGHKSHILNLV